MRTRATEGTVSKVLLDQAIPLLQEAEQQCPRTGPGAKPKVPDWMIAAMIQFAVLHKKKSKSAQYRFLNEPARRALFGRDVAMNYWPSRSTFFRRYRGASRLLEAAVRIQAGHAIEEGIVDPKLAAVDKSLIAAKGPPWHQRQRKAGKLPRGADGEAAWGYSEHDGWVYGYSFEVVVSATARGVVLPLLASVDVASSAETRSFAPKIDLLPAAVRFVAADAGYDANALGERLEYDDRGRRTGCRYLCPENPRNAGRAKTKPGGADAARALSRQRRAKRKAFLDTARGRALYRRRSLTVEPFNAWFKQLFEYEREVWHRGILNNRTQILAAMFAYQTLVRHNHRLGNQNGRLKWIIDAL
jgi:hypothetical protein